MNRAWVLLVVALSGCASRVRLAPPPPASAGVAERLDVFDRLKPRWMTATTTSRNDMVIRIDSSLILADGTEVSAPEDLLPVVPADSASARAARRAVRARSWKWGGFAFAGGAVLGGFMMRDNDLEADNTLANIVMLGGAAIGSLAAIHFTFRENAARHEAYLQYSTGLLQQLRLCATGLDIHECN